MKARLLVYGQGGSPVQRPLPSESWDRWLEAVFAASPTAAAAWKTAGILTSRHLFKAWPAAIARPTNAFLRSGSRFGTGAVFQVEASELDVEELADDLVRAMQGLEPARRFDAVPVAPAPDEPAEAAPAVELDVAVAEEVDSSEQPVPPEQAPTITEEEPAAVEAAPVVEVLPPSNEPDAEDEPDEADVFGFTDDLAGVLDTGVEIRIDDLPGLGAGDQIFSQARGRCRILSVDEDQSEIKVEDERGKTLAIDFQELVNEFSFDDPE